MLVRHNHGIDSIPTPYTIKECLMSNTGNLLLDSLRSPSVVESIMSFARKVEIPSNHRFWSHGVMPARLVFLTSGVAPTTSQMKDGKTPEVGLIGRDGLIGFQTLFGRVPITTRQFMLGPGKGLEVPREHLVTLFINSLEFRSRILEFAAVQSDINAQLMGCNAVHQIDCRLARWLSMVSTQREKGIVHATQEAISALLGVRRSSVCLACSALEKRNIIRTKRGVITILNGEALAARSCECGQVYRELQQSLYQSNDFVEDELSDESSQVPGLSMVPPSQRSPIANEART
jgi:CRP-like cAMP-binding protein